MSVNSSKHKLKMLRCIENNKINIQSKFHVSTVIYFRVTHKTKIDFVKN